MSLQQGTTAYYAPGGTAWTALAPGGQPAAPWVQITRGISVRLVPHEVDKYDRAPLEATARDMQRDLTPGNAVLTVEEVDAQSIAIRGFCDSGAKKAFAVVMLDGNAEYSANGQFHCTSAIDANKGDFKARIPEVYQYDADGVFTRQAHT